MESPSLENLKEEVQRAVDLYQASQKSATSELEEKFKDLTFKVEAKEKCLETVNAALATLEAELSANVRSSISGASDSTGKVPIKQPIQIAVDNTARANTSSNTNHNREVAVPTLKSKEQAQNGLLTTSSNVSTYCLTNSSSILGLSTDDGKSVLFELKMGVHDFAIVEVPEITLPVCVGIRPASITIAKKEVVMFLGIQSFAFDCDDRKMIRSRLLDSISALGNSTQLMVSEKYMDFTPNIKGHLVNFRQRYFFLKTLNEEMQLLTPLFPANMDPSKLALLTEEIQSPRKIIVSKNHKLFFGIGRTGKFFFGSPALHQQAGINIGFPKGSSDMAPDATTMGWLDNNLITISPSHVSAFDFQANKKWTYSTTDEDNIIDSVLGEDGVIGLTYQLLDATKDKFELRIYQLQIINDQLAPQVIKTLTADAKPTEIQFHQKSEGARFVSYILGRQFCVCKF